MTDSYVYSGKLKSYLESCFLEEILKIKRKKKKKTKGP